MSRAPAKAQESVRDAAEPSRAPIERPLLAMAVFRSAQTLCRVGCSVAFDFKVFGLEHIPSSGGVLIVSNHQSYLDPVLIGVRLRRPLSYMARSGLFEVNPAFTWLIRALGAFPVRQEGSAAGAVKTAIHRLREGHALNMYPEGSRTEDGEIARIEGGASLVIRGARVPVVPAVIDGSFEAWPRDHLMPLPHPIRVQYGPAMELAHLRPAEITRRIDQTLRRMFADLRREHPCRPDAAALPRPRGSRDDACSPGGVPGV